MGSPKLSGSQTRLTGLHNNNKNSTTLNSTMGFTKLTLMSNNLTIGSKIDHQMNNVAASRLYNTRKKAPLCQKRSYSLNNINAVGRSPHHRNFHEDSISEVDTTNSSSGTQSKASSGYTHESDKIGAVKKNTNNDNIPLANRFT